MRLLEIYQTYKFRIFFELLERLGEAGAMEIVEDRFMPGDEVK